MTRKEERNKASIDYADKFMAEVNKINDEQWKWAQKHPDEPTVAGGVKACWIFQRSAFLAGAEWADAHPVHYDGQAKADVFIEKACVNLKKLMYDNLMFQGRLHREEVINSFVEDFKKTLEE